VARVLLLLPARDFDPSEAAVSWRVLVDAGHIVGFATPDGLPAAADEIMVTGKGLDLWGTIPVLRNWPLIGLLLRANRDAREAYAGMIADPNYLAPQRWDAVDPAAFDALLLPGGHRARGMRDYLESEILQRHVTNFFEANKPVAAICHGVLLAAQHFEPHRPFGALWVSNDRLDLGAGTPRLVARPRHAVLGSALLSDLSGAGRTAQWLYVGATGSDARARPRRRLPGRPGDGSGLPPQDVRAATRFHRRCEAGLCGPGSQLRFGKMARRRAYPREDLCRHAEQASVTLREGD